MADIAPEDANGRQQRQNALSEIQFASIVDGDLTPSEDETQEEKAIRLEDVQSAIGVSIGHAQTHLTSPKTPAAEKAAALEDEDVERGGRMYRDEFTDDEDATERQDVFDIGDADEDGDDNGGKKYGK